MCYVPPARPRMKWTINHPRAHATARTTNRIKKLRISFERRYGHPNLFGPQTLHTSLT
jgi:hypothetical protein